MRPKLQTVEMNSPAHAHWRAMTTGDHTRHLWLSPPVRWLGWTSLLAVVVALTVVAGGPIPTRACEICGQPTLTLADRIGQSDVALLAKWVLARAEKGNQGAVSVFEVVDVVEGSTDVVQIGKTVSLPGFHGGEKGALRLLTADVEEGQKIRWGEPLEITPACWKYAIEAPDPDTDWSERLLYYFQFLEHADVLIANDAHAEIVNAPTDDISRAAEELGPDRIRRWLQAPRTPAMRKGAYWVLLGFCGDDGDADRLEEQVQAESKNLRLGLQGLIFGYLQLTGERGLAVVVDRYLSKPTDADATNELGDALKAVIWCQNNGNRRIPDQSLQAALRPLFVHPAHGELVITTLARWKDWSLLEELVEKYGTPGFEAASTRRCIARYIAAATLDRVDTQVRSGKPPEVVLPHVAAAERCLAQLQQRDPKLVEAAIKALKAEATEAAEAAKADGN
jgi:hypothetical protein